MNAPQKHKWGEPVRFERKTERECANGCGVVKVTRHEHENHWVEFWREQERVETPGDRTPPCEPRETRP